MPELPEEPVICYDRANDTVTIDGLVFSRAVFKHLARPTPEGRALRVIKVEGGVVTVMEVKL